jgi:hypothetical protein
LPARAPIGQTARVIRNVVIHQQGQLPMVADLRELPAVGDVNLICTNVRTTDGKRPTFVDEQDSWFFIPLMTIRFLEVPKASLAAVDTGMEDLSAQASEEETAPVDEGPTEPDPDLLARIREV